MPVFESNMGGVDVAVCECAALAAEVRVLRDLVFDLTAQGCQVGDDEFDSGAISTYADALDYLADIGLVTIHTHAGRRVLARRVQQ